ncbi:MAG TPA: deoxyribose-phosphate aldolase [Candidatus Kapabacteria bacterium]|nr:deoxyribose-phosphate aldolase [Candidatus Kapabacteria bacterium]
MTTHIELARYIDHTALKPDTTEEQIRQLCVEADELGFAAVCVMPYWVPLCSLVLDELGASLAIATTIGFPNGSHQTVVKVAETKKAIYDGAQEIDMVINVGALRSGHRAVVMADMMAVAMSAHEHGALVKVIIETSLLNDDQKRLACELAGEAGVDFVKTSTGFAGGGATVADIELMREASPKRMQIKASGGIRDAATAIRMIAAGASRIGTSSGVSIVRESVDA